MLGISLMGLASVGMWLLDASEEGTLQLSTSHFYVT
jgi:hypothetical protein